MRCRRARAWRSGRGGEGMVGGNKRMEGRKSRSRPLPGQRHLRSVCNTPSHLGGARLRVRGSLAQPASSRPFSGGRLPAKAIKGSECDIHPVFPQIPAGPGCALPGLPVIRPRPSGGHRVCRGFPVRQVARCIRIASMPLLCVGIGCGVVNATDFTIPAASDGNGNTVLSPAGCARLRCALRRHARGGGHVSLGRRCGAWTALSSLSCLAQCQGWDGLRATGPACLGQAAAEALQRYSSPWLLRPTRLMCAAFRSRLAAATANDALV